MTHQNYNNIPIPAQNHLFPVTNLGHLKTMFLDFVIHASKTRSSGPPRRGRRDEKVHSARARLVGASRIFFIGTGIHYENRIFILLSLLE